MTCEGYFGHRTRIYELDLYNQPEKIASVIRRSYQIGVRAMNLPNTQSILDALDILKKESIEMKLIGTIGHTDVNYLMPDFKKAREEADYIKDIESLSYYDTPVMLVDDMLVDAYDWDYTSKILEEIKDHGIMAGIITSRTFNTTRELINGNLDLDLFDFYMLPINKVAYTMDVDFFVDNEKEELSTMLNKLDKNIIVSRLLACGIQRPEEAFNFFKTLDYADMACVSAASQTEAEQTFGVLKDL